MERLDEVKKNVLEIAGHVKNEIEEVDLRKNYPNFVKEYPSLFKMVMENGNYMEILDRMIDAAKRVEAKEYSIEEMDKMVGFELAKEYIYPHIDMSKEKDFK